MEVKHEQCATKGIFYIEENGGQVAMMVYTFKGDGIMVIEHTVVNPGNEGKGLGKQLVNAAVDFARKNNHKILPLCPYAKAVLEKSDSYSDVLVK